MRAAVPGLITLSVTQDVGSVLQGSYAQSDERLAAVASHRTLVPPNVFNVSTLFQPTLAFVETVSAIVPPGFENETETFGSTLEDFVQTVFLPQLDEKVNIAFQTAVAGHDAFHTDRGLPDFRGSYPSKVRTSPSSDAIILIGQSSMKVLSLIFSLCEMLRMTPFHHENYSRLVLGVIVQYYQQCSTYYRGKRASRASLRFQI